MPPRGPDFAQAVYALVQLIPEGRVSTYGHIAAALGHRAGARLVGYCLNHCNALGLSHVPAHRVVNRNGLLTGKHHFGTPQRMQQLLEDEGVVVVNDQVQDFGRLLWDPLRELDAPGP